MKKQFKTFEDVWQSLEEGKEVYWKNSAYRVIAEPDRLPNQTAYQLFRKRAERGGFILTVRYINNNLGSILMKQELGEVYVKSNQRTKERMPLTVVKKCTG